MLTLPESTIKVEINEDCLQYDIMFSRPPKQFTAMSEVGIVSLAWHWGGSVISIKSNANLNGITIYLG